MTRTRVASFVGSWQVTGWILGRSEDRLADSWWERWTRLDQLAQIRGEFRCFLPVLLRLDYWAVGRVDVTGVMIAG